MLQSYKKKSLYLNLFFNNQFSHAYFIATTIRPILSHLSVIQTLPTQWSYARLPSSARQSLATLSSRFSALQNYKENSTTVPHLTAFYRILPHFTAFYRLTACFPLLGADIERITSGYVADI